MVIRFGGFILDGRRFELRRAGVRLAVQPKVMDVLLYLAERRDRMVGKHELLAAVWPGVSVSDASLSQAISQARRVLGDGAEAQRFIRTVRGRGFQFVAPAVDEEEITQAILGARG